MFYPDRSVLMWTETGLFSREKYLKIECRCSGLIGTLRYGGADALKYAIVKESLGRERNVCGGKTKLRFVASDVISFSSSIDDMASFSRGNSRTVVYKQCNGLYC